MAIKKQILILIALFTLTAGQVFAQRCQSHCSWPKNVTVGFYKGVQLLDVSRNGFKPHYLVPTDKISVTIPVINHLLAELSVQFYNLPISNWSKIYLSNNKYQFGLPFGVRYYPFCNGRINPYLGVGGYYNNNVPMPNNDANSWYNKMGVLSPFLSQGIDVQLNKRVNITETIHMIGTDGQNIGFNVGINFKLP
jgi:hypothetical protein